MKKYNYLKAGKIYDKMYNLCVDPWELSDSEKQQARREFMYALTRNDKKFLQSCIEYILDWRENVCFPYPNPEAKSKCWDFDLMRQYDALINEIKTFEN